MAAAETASMTAQPDAPTADRDSPIAKYTSTGLIANCSIEIKAQVRGSQTLMAYA